jgi:hypothetical protein
MKRDWGQTVDAILALLKECGPMSPAEIAMELGLDRMNVSTIMTRMRTPLKKKPKRITIIRYVYDNEGQRRYPRPVYALGAGIDVRRPKSNPKENKRRYLKGLRTKMTANSVFNLAMTRKQYMELKRGKIETAGAC